MKKIILIVILDVLFLALLFFGYTYYRKSKLPSASKVTPTPQLTQELNGYPYVKWEEITSGNLIKSVKNKADNIGAGAEPIQSYGILNPTLEAQKGMNYVQLLGSEIFATNKYADINKRPFRTVAYFSTSKDSTDYLVLVQKWLNKDSTTAYLTYLIPKSKALKNNIPNDYFSGILAEQGSKYVLAPILTLNSLETCKFNYRDSISYCNWYFGNPEIKKSNQKPPSSSRSTLWARTRRFAFSLFTSP